MKLSKEELIQIKHERYLMEQFVKYVEKLELAHKMINNILHKSCVERNWNEVQKISDKIMEHI